MQHLTEVLVAGIVTAGTTIAHRSTGGKQPRPKCMPTDVPGARWTELSAGRALDLGAVPCTETACAQVSA